MSYFGIALVNPKTPENVGGSLRAAHCYGASLIIVSGSRFVRHATDTPKTWAHVPVLRPADIWDCIPFDCVPVAVDLLPNACPLPQFRHPPRALYIFGAEDATLGKSVTERATWKVMVPTRHCMNLAACVNVVLYDRMAKATGREARRLVSDTA